MLRFTLRLNALSFRGKYPYVIEFHKLPWKCIPPSSALAHEHGSFYYQQILDLATRSNMPSLVNDFHPTVAEDRMGTLLPGSVYIVPEVRTLLEVESEWGPYNWQGTQVVNDMFTTYYGGISSQIAPLQEVWEFMSPDLKLLCTALCFGVPTAECESDSSLSQLKTNNKDFVLFHFYRPNRPVSEFVRPLEKFFVQKPKLDFLSGLDAFEPVELPVRSPNVKAKEMAAFIPPTSFMSGIPEREALKPGDCIGTRRNAWGMGY
eukprot:PhM_4_TR1496/c0_g1_i1/m.2058